MFYDDDDDTQDASDTLGEMADGVSTGARQVGDAVADDARQTKEDVEDFVKGDDDDDDDD